MESSGWEKCTQVRVWGEWKVVFCDRCHDVIASSAQAISRHLASCDSMDREDADVVTRQTAASSGSLCKLGAFEIRWPCLASGSM